MRVAIDRVGQTHTSSVELIVNNGPISEKHVNQEKKLSDRFFLKVKAYTEKLDHIESISDLMLISRDRFNADAKGLTFTIRQLKCQSYVKVVKPLEINLHDMSASD